MKNIIVTGASGNMGQAVVQKFLNEGYHVTGTAVPNDPVALEINHPAFEKAVVDLLNENEAGEFVKQVTDKHSSIDAAVLTVGGFAMGKMADTVSAAIYKQYQLNFETAYHIARPVFLQMMKQGYGRIFLIGSKPGLAAVNSKGMLAYGLTKSLIFRLAEMMNDEAKGTNVVTAVLVPSTLDTAQNRKSMPDADFDTWVQPSAVADNIFFYCSEAASVVREPVIKLYNKS